MSGDIQLVKRIDRPVNPKLLGFPERVQTVRNFYGWTQQELADAAGVEQPSISRYEQGKRLGGLSVDTLLKLSDATKASLIWLATGEGPMFRKGAPVRLVEPAEAPVVESRKRKTKSS